MSIVRCPRCDLRYDANHYAIGAPISCRCGSEFYVPSRSTSAHQFNCPSCGGDADPNKNVCQYCNVHLSFTRCSACFSHVHYRGAKFCAECGENLNSAALAVEAAATHLPCPRCGPDNTLKRQKVGRYFLDGCTGCGGIWLDHHELDKLLAHTQQKRNSNAVLNKKAKRISSNDGLNFRYLPCPECNDIMNRRNFSQRSGIIVDECSAHGIWFDKHELANALHYVRSSHADITAEQALDSGIKATEAMPGAPKPLNKESMTGALPFGIDAYNLERIFVNFPGFIGFFD